MGLTRWQSQNTTFTKTITLITKTKFKNLNSLKRSVL